MIKVTPTHTGIIYVDTDKQLEFLSVGDYGKENNIKANFLGLNQEINGVANTSVDLKDKWVATISTQKGCPMKCKFCDVPRYGYHGNVSFEDLAYQIETIIKCESVTETDRFNVHFARMGEPTWNVHVLEFTIILKKLVQERIISMMVRLDYNYQSILQMTIKEMNCLLVEAFHLMKYLN